MKLNKQQYIEYLAEKDVRKEICSSAQTFAYQCNSMSSTNGQAPFITLWFYLGEAKNETEREDLAMLTEEFLKQRIKGMKNKQGVYVAVAFPKLVVCLDEHMNKRKELKRLAAECSAKRLVPDYVSEKVMKENKVNMYGYGDAYPPMGCRSILSPWYVGKNISRAMNYEDGASKYYGRFNIGVTSINLPYVAFEAKKTKKDFFDVLDKYADLAHEMQKIRAERISKTKAKAAPILWCDGACARLDPEENLHDIVHNRYATSSIGYAGLYEAVKVMTGKDFWKDKKAEKFAESVLSHLNDLCDLWADAENIGYSIYGTPNESGTYKMALAVKRKFGEDAFSSLDGHDRDYVTNSCHVPVFEEIDAFDKLSAESKYQKLSPGGNIVYIEMPDMTKNIDAVMQLQDYIYDTCIYAELNSEVSYCACCGSNNSVKLMGEREEYVPTCNVCGNTDRNKMNYCIRVCGYISTNSFNNGRAEDIHDRVKHIDNKEI